MDPVPLQLTHVATACHSRVYHMKPCVGIASGCYRLQPLIPTDDRARPSFSDQRTIGVYNALIGSRNRSGYKDLLFGWEYANLHRFSRNIARNKQATMSQISRKVIKSVYAVEQSEGVGARVRRSIGSLSLHNLSPFLMLDHFHLKPGSGFADHPHRGQTTVTYMLKGKMQHEDSAGNRGQLGPGDLQWMTAGRGVVHAEMPIFEYGGDEPDGMQLWIDLPRAKKGVKANYQEMKAESLKTVYPNEQAEITIISGESHGESGPVRPLGECWYFDFKLKVPGASVFQPLPEGWTAFIYLIQGSVKLGDSKETFEEHNTMVLSSAPDQSGITITAAPDSKGARGVLIAGKPLDQPIYQHGPFVVSNRQEAIQAIKDYQTGKNGFEGAVGWRSEIARDM